MGTKFLVAFIASMAIGAQARPIVFTSAQYDTVAVAVVGALADVHSDISPPSSLPILSTATVSGANDFATSFALGSSGLLSAFSEADSFPGAVGASAEAQSHFLGTFLGSGPLSLHLGFDDLNSLVGGASADAILFVLLTNTLGTTTTTVFNNFFTVGRGIDLQFTVPGTINTLDLVLFSEAATTGAGQSGQNFSQVSFVGTVPLPATPLLVIAGLAAMLTARRKRKNATD